MRQSPAIKDMPLNERPLSEQYRLAANAWVKADGEARQLEERKSIRLEQLKNALILGGGPMPDNRAEREIKASEEWDRFIVEMVDARTRANALRVTVKEIEMQEREYLDRSQTIRAEMRMSR